MSKSSILNGILIGLIIVLLGVILLQGSSTNAARAAVVVGKDNTATTPSETGMSAGGVVAVTGQYDQNNSVLYVIDTNREVILTYACYPKSNRDVFKDPVFDFLHGRSYAWDAAYCQKGAIYGVTAKFKTGEVRDKMKGDKTEPAN